jgi:hypothetical protein
MLVCSPEGKSHRFLPQRAADFQKHINGDNSAKGASLMRKYLYFLPLIAGPVLLVLAAFLILPTPWFALHAQDPWMFGLGYGAELKHADCQVVIYGDSTGEVGIVPEIIRQRTGLKTCNIAQEQGLIALSGDFVLHDYLRQNVPPRILVFMYSVEDMNPQSAHVNHSVFEGLTYQMGRNHRITTLARLWRTPEDAFRWTYKGLHMAIVDGRTKPAPEGMLTERERTMGRLALVDLRMKNCSNMSKTLAPDAAWIRGLRTLYSSPPTAVLIDLMPIPECDAGYPLLQRRFAGLIDNQVKQLPDSYYFRDGLHVDDDGAAVLSEQVAAQIIQRMHAKVGGESR